MTAITFKLTAATATLCAAITTGCKFNIPATAPAAAPGQPIPARAAVPVATTIDLRAADLKQRLRSQNNLKQILLGFHQYHDKYNFLPRDISSCGKPLLSWRVAILPFIGQDELYKQFKLDE